MNPLLIILIKNTSLLFCFVFYVKESGHCFGCNLAVAYSAMSCIVLSVLKEWNKEIMIFTIFVVLLHV